MADETPIKRALRWARESLGLNQSAFARLLDVPTQNVGNWKKRGLPADQYPRVAALLGRTVEELVHGNTTPANDLLALINTLAPDEQRKARIIIETLRTPSTGRERHAEIIYRERERERERATSVPAQGNPRPARIVRRERREIANQRRGCQPLAPGSPAGYSGQDQREEQDRRAKQEEQNGQFDILVRQGPFDDPQH